MYIECQRSKNGKVFYFLRESKRDGKKIVKTTLLNLTPWGEDFCEGLSTFLKNYKCLNVKDNVCSQLISASESGAANLGHFVEPPVLTQGKAFGPIWLLYQTANKLGIVDALGDSDDGRLALWQVMARVIAQGSRLSSTRLIKGFETAFLRLPDFDEDRLYFNLDWLDEHQKEIEQRLYKKRWGDKPCNLFLYDVTSSYFEGEQNELAAYGYNRDKKRGKKQVVIGLLCDSDGLPVSIEVFKGNTNDLKTFRSQVEKVMIQYKSQKVTFVGDRGMIKSTQQKDLNDYGFYYITALTRKQIETLLNQNKIQPSLFDEELSEIVLDDKRYIMRRNPIRAQEIADSRQLKQAVLETLVTDCNQYLQTHVKSQTETQIQKINRRIKKLGCSSWLGVQSTERNLHLKIDEGKVSELAMLDGCYCLISDLPEPQADKETIHTRYKDLGMVENAFRTMKTMDLEMRPLYVRKESRTRGHAFVVMLSFLIIRHLRTCWATAEVTPEEGIALLREMCIVNVSVGKENYTVIPKPRPDLAALFSQADVALPDAVPAGTPANVVSRRILTSRRKSK